MIGDKKYFLIMIIVLILISIGGVWASENHTDDAVAASDADHIAVDSGDDIGKDTSTVKENLTSQKNDEAVKTVDSESNKNGEILGASNDEDILGDALPPINGGTVNNLDGSKTYTTSGISLTSGTTIYGHGCTISGSNANKIFEITNAKNIKISDIKFINAKNSNRGGAVIISGNSGNITFINCIFEKNTANSGGAVGVSGTTDDQSVGSCSFINCTFNENTATASSTIAGGGAFAATYATKISFENCNFYKNTCPNNDGGAIYLNRIDEDHDYPNTRELNVTNCNFTSNSAKVGGAIKYSFTTSSLYCDGCIFKENKATNGQGADISIPSGKNGVTYDVINSKFRNSKATKEGASIYFKATSLNLVNCSFDNLQPQSNGGAVYALKSGSNSLSVTIDGCNFTNVLTYHAVYIKDEASVNITNSKFENNTATDNPAIYLNGNMTSLSIEGTTFIGNKATSGNGGALFISSDNSGLTFNKCIFINNTASGLGGAVYFEGSSSDRTFDGLLFDGNKATSGGAIYFNQAMSNLNIKNSKFTNNDATSKGGAIYLPAALTGVTIEDSSFENNSASSGGAIQFNADLTTTDKSENIDIINSNFTNNKATGTSADANAVVGGSAINFMAVTDVDFDNCIFEDNVANSKGALRFVKFSDIYYNACKFNNNNATHGGAIYYQALSTYDRGNSTYAKCSFDNNYATANGGAIYTLGNDVTIRESNFTNNHADAWAGGIQMGDDAANFATANLIITKSRFINNIAADAGAVDAYGTSDVRISESVFEENSGRYGGAVYLTGNYGVITKSNFTNNKGAQGSAISYYPQGVGVVAATKGNITYCNFNGNNATTGGTVWFRSSQGNIMHCNFNDNTAGKAGAIYVDIDQVTIDDNEFTGNNATSGDGGAIYVVDLSTVHGTVISNSVFNKNYASGNGGAVYDAATNDGITKCDFTANRAGADGGAVYFASSGGSITYSNFTNNVATNGGAVVMAKGGVSISNSKFIGNNATNEGGAVQALGNIYGLTIDDSTFKQNSANNGGAVNYLGAAGASGNSLTFSNDIFEDNTAIYNGGAIHYLVDAVDHYRDYNLFEGEGRYTDTTTYTAEWTHDGKNIITNSIIKGNIDYYMNVTATVQGYTVTLTVTVPNRANKASGVITLTINNGTQITTKTIQCSSLDNEHYYVDGDYTIIKVVLDEQAIASYNVTVGFNDNKHDLKSQNVSYDVVKTEVGDFTYIQELIDAAILNAHNNGQTVAKVTLNRTYTYNVELDHGQINITNPYVDVTSIIIDGVNSSQINALNKCRIFDVRANNVVINNILFRNGDANGANSSSDDKLHGGAILWTGSNGLLYNSTFRNNTAYDGGAVFVQNGLRDRIVNCEFTGNDAIHNGGAIDWNATEGNVTDSRFFYNNASYGGAIFVGAAGTTSHIYNSNFTGNLASERGGAVDWYASSGDIMLSRFEGNNASYGGAVFVGSQTDSGKIMNSTFIKNTATQNGGAIDWNATNGNVEYSTFKENSAAYGGAVFVGANSNGGTIYNSTFTKNTATQNGGAIDWNASNGNVEKSSFYDNTALNGGAVFVGANGEAGKITYSVFEGNNATSRGGAVDWFASAGEIEYSNFTDNNAAYGGAVFVGKQTEGGNITNSRFIRNTATENGGAIDWNASSGVLKESYFDNNEAYKGGAVYLGSATQGETITLSNFTNNKAVNSGHGGAIYCDKALGEVDDSIFERNTATEGGAIYIKDSTSAGTISGSTFNENEATLYGGAVAIKNVGDVNVSHSTFNDNVGFEGAALYIKETSNFVVNDTKFNSNDADLAAVNVVQSSGVIAHSEFENNEAAAYTGIYMDSCEDVNVTDTTFKQTAMANGGTDIIILRSNDIQLDNLTLTYNNRNSNPGIMAGGNVTFNDIKINNWNSTADNIAAISVGDGNFSISNSVIDGSQAVMIADSAITYLSNVNNTGASEGAYSVYNNGILYLNKNNFDNVIINYGIIKTNTTTKVLDNDTLVIKIGQDALLNASIVDDNNNVIVMPDLKFTANGVECADSTYADKYHKGTYTTPAQGVYLISVTPVDRLEKNTLQTGVLKVKDPNTSIKLNITQERQGEIVTIKANITHVGSIPAEGDVTFVVDGIMYKAHINETKALDGSCIATLTLNNLTPDVYSLTAIYNGDDIHMGCQATDSFVVYPREANLTVTVKNIVEGQDAIAVVNTTASNGTVTFYFNGKSKAVKVQNGIAMLNLTELLPQLSAGNYSIDVSYNDENGYYKPVQNSTNFTVYEYDMKVDVSETQYNQSAVITVTLPQDAQGTPVVTLNGEVLPVTDNHDGTFTAVSDKLTKTGEYEVNVTYAGDDKYYARNVTGYKFNVTASEDFDFNMTVTPSDIKFGDNVTVNITGPAGLQVNLTIDGVTETVTLNENGTYVKTISNLTAGDHTIIANLTGNENYTSKEIQESFTIDKSEPSIFDVVINPIEVGQTAVVNVTLPDDATGTVSVVLNGTKYTADVVNGTAIVNVPNLGNGTYPVEITYSGDENYNSTTAQDQIVVSQVDPQIKVNVTDITLGDVAVINVTLPDDATGTVTVKVDGIEKTVPVVGGVNSIEIPGITVGTKDVNVTYNGNGKYTAQSNTDKQITVSPVDTEIESITPVIDDDNNVTVIVKVPADATGNVTVKIGNKTYNATVENGTAIVNVGVLDKGDYDINVTYSGDENYTSANNITSISVPGLVNYDMPMDATDVAYGANATVTVTLPAGAKKENLTFIVDGTPVTDFVYDNTTGVATLTIVNPKAGNHTVKAVYAADDLYADNENSTTFNVASAVPGVFDVVINPIEVGQTAVVNVTLPKDATGTVSVVVNGTKYTADVVNGTAIVKVPNLGNGTYPVEVTYSGDNNYNATSQPDQIVVSQVDPQIKVNTTDITLGDVAVINVTLPSDATGTVTVKVDGIEKTVPVVGGVNSIEIPGITVGTKDINVTYNGNGKYAAQSNTDKQITVSPVDTVIESITPVIDDYNNVTVVVSIPGATDGNVTVKIGNETYNATVENGIANVNIGVLPEGVHDINVTYSGNENYTSTSNQTTITVPALKNYPMPMTATDVDYGANATVTVTLPAGAKKENLTFIVDGTPVTDFVYDNTTGVATLTIVNPAAGEHTVKAVYSDDGVYADNENSTTFNVANVVPGVFDVVIDPIEVGQTAVVNVTLPKDATGTVSVVVNGTKYTADVVNGTAIINVPNLGNGTYPVEVTYSGDNNYNATSQPDQIVVSQVDPQIKVNTTDITLGDVAVINVTLPSDATGTVTVKVDGIEKTVPVVGGVNSIEIPGITVGTKDVNVTYNGNGKYAAQSNTDKQITVKPVVTDIESITPVIDDDNNVTVIVKVPADATGNVTVKIGNKTYNATVENGTAIVNVGVLDKGDYDINVTYSGDENYTSANKTDSISVPGLVNYDLPMDASDVAYGANATVTVTLPENARIENLTFIVDGTPVPASEVSYDPTTRVASITVVNPKAGNHTVKAVYAADDLYADNENSTTFNIASVDPNVFDISFEPAQPVDVGSPVNVIVTLPDDANGTVTLNFNGTKYVGEVVNGVANITVSNLGDGVHNFTATYSGDGNYNPVVQNSSVQFDKVVPAIVVNTTDITLGDVAVINVTLPDDATGTVTIKVDGIEKTVPVIGGVNTIEIPGITVGTKDINVTYNGNNKYAAESNTDKQITVKPVVTEIESIDTQIDDDNNVTVIVKVPADATGNVTVKIGNKTYNATVENGTAIVNIGVLDKGDYDINVTYSGDENYTSANKTDSITVPGLVNYDMPMDATDVAYGANATVTVTLPAGAKKENLTFIVDGTPVTDFVYDNTTGVATLTIVNPKAGNHTVKAVYAADDLYADNENSTTFNVANVVPGVFDVVIDPIEVGQTAVVNVTLPKDATGTVSVVVNGTKYTADVVNGTAIINVPNLGNGTYPVEVTYSGDNNYNATSQPDQIVVSQVDPQIKVNTTDITLGDVAVINVTLPSDATGTVTVKVDGIEKTVPVVGGVNSIEIPGITVGTKDVNVTYNGNGKYAAQSNTDKQITVKPVVTDIESITIERDDDNNVTVVVKVPEDATGNVTVKIGNKTYNATVENGTAIVNIGVLDKGDYDINVTYSGDENYTSANKTIPISVPGLVNYDLPMTAGDVDYGANATVTVTLPAGAKKENLTFIVDGVNVTDFEFDETTGVATLTIVNPTAGDHTVKAFYAADDLYADNENSTSFTVAKVEAGVFDVVINPIEVGQTAVVNVTLPDDATGTVTVVVNGTKYTADVVDGKAIINVPNLGNGTYPVDITYSGDDNYNSTTKQDEIIVSKVDPQVQVNVSDITLGDVAVINVTLPSDATGTVTVKVDGIEKTVLVGGGVNSIEIPGITVGTKDINVTYNGNDKYAAQSVTDKQITVSPVVTEIESITPVVDDDNNVTVIVKVPADATGNVTVKIGNKTYNATVENGTAIVNIGVLDKGDYDINVTYSGDENYTSANGTASINVPGLVNYDLPMETSDIDYGANATVTVTLPAGAKLENLTFYVDDAEIPASEVSYDPSTGVASITVVNPKAGDHTVKVTYAEDDLYADNENSTTFNVAKVQPANPQIDINQPINVGDDLNITVKLPEDATGQIIVDVNGSKYVYDIVNGSVNISIPNLGNGTYAVNVTYSGDDNYDPISVDETVEVDKITPEVAANTTDITLGENAVIDVTLPADATGNVTIKIGDVVQTSPVQGGVNHITVPGIPVGKDQVVEVTYNGNGKYTPNSTTTSITVNPKPTSPDDVKIIDNGDGTITVIVPDNATGNITVKIGNETLPAVNLTNGKAVINLSNSSQKPGKHNITVSYSGDENHTAVDVNAIGEIPKWDSSVNATAAKIREGDNATIVVEVAPKDATGKVYVKIGDSTYAADVQDGKAVINAPGLKQGTHDINVTYAGDNYYNPSNTQTQIVVEKPITVEVNGSGEDSKVIIDLPDGATENVTAYIDGNEVPVVFDGNGTPTVNLSDVAPGKHNITIVYVDENNNTSIVTKEIIVPKWPSTINASAPIIREGDVLPVTVTGGSTEMNGLALVDLNGTGYYVNLTDGKAVVNVPGLTEGVYDANVTYLGDDKYDVTNNTFTVTVEAPLKISVEGAGNNTQIVVDLPVNGTENVTVIVDGKEIPVSVQDGKAVANLTNITAGDHNVTVVYTDKYGTQSVVNTTINVYNSIKSNDMKRGWNSPYDYEAEFLDKDGHVLANTQVVMKVNGKSYNVMTDAKGIAKLTESHLAVGKYDVELLNPVTGETAKNTVTIVERLIQNKDITMDYLDGSQYVVRVIGDDGNPVGAGEVVGFKVHNVEYNGITDKDGYARLTISLLPTKYTITAQYTGYKVSNKIVVKQTLKLVKKTVTVKKGKKLILKATLKWTNGKAIKGKKIKFTFKGKTYTAKTNSKGIAKVTIKAKVTKKLKAGKKYAYSAKYVNNVVKGKVKVKK